MASKRRGGFKPPSDYDPRRGKSGGSARNGRGAPDRVGRGQGAAAAADARGGSDRRGASAQGGAPETRGFSEKRGASERSRDNRPQAEAPTSSHPLRRPKRATPDVALERIEAKVTTAADVRGVTFADLGLGGNLVRTLGELGADRPFPIQAATIPDTIAGRNVLGRARTGSGKTIAFGAAIVERLLKLKAEGAFAADPSRSDRKAPRGERQERGTRRPPRKPKALILAPTRELALQIDRTVQPLARSVGFYTAQFVGGMPIEPQVHALERGIDIVIGTPGRVQDLINRRKLDLREVLVSVIDEADHMCELGFLPQVQEVLRHTDRNGQRLLFSATLDTEVSALIAEFLPQAAAHEAEEAAAGDIEHRVYMTSREESAQALVDLASGRGRTMVFCRTRAAVDRVAEMLSEAGIRATALHGDLSQPKRESSLARFADGKARVLVATDVAARGIHVDDVDLVLQADPPGEYKSYLHRAGRTGRAGKNGLVITLIPRTRQTFMREMLASAEIEPAEFVDYAAATRRTPKKGAKRK